MSNNSTSSSDSEHADCVTPLPKSQNSTRKRPRSSHDFFDLLICPICYDYFTPPVINCTKGHSYCLACMDRMERLTGDARCPQCRGAINKTSRNRLIEDQLEKVTVGCLWNKQGCNKRVSLSARQSHETECEHNPESVVCYFSMDSANPVCKWKGNPMILPQHLQKSHGIEPIQRGKLVKFLWNPPKIDTTRARHRVLQISYPSLGYGMTNFILEHVYNPECEMLLFLVRTLNPDVKLTYKIHLLNREEDSNRITFKAKTVDFNEFGFLEKYPELDSRKCFAIHNRTIQDYSFVNPDDNMTYFSFHIEFCGAGVEGLDY